MRADAREIARRVASLTGPERSRAIDELCGGDAALRARVVEALEADAAPTSGDTGRAEGTGARGGAGVGSGGSGGGPDAAAARSEPGPGGTIGRYRLLQQIGEGGFGSVYMAEQDEPVRRRVALKLLKPGMDSRAVVARFEAERQALAMMDHPNIARVFDAGATEGGLPYFVMELVPGEPITEFCDRATLQVRERLELFVQVCRAVHHAHMKGVIHRDIKPTNVLVSSLDGRAIAKVIDFGVAKATSRPLTDRTLFTEHRALIGTIEYMSPEQAQGSLDIDTRTDIYSLGVLLYELLTGLTPFDGRRLRAAAFGEVQRIISQEEPKRPSTRLATIARAPGGTGAGRTGPGQTMPEWAARPDAEGGSAGGTTIEELSRRRRTDAGSLVRAIRGDLDWITLKALDKDRARRYESAGAMAADIERTLSGQPVTAAPPSAAYRARKFVRRHRTGVAAAGFVGLALVAGVVGTTIGMVRAVRAESRAESQRDLADLRRQETEKVAEFQEGMLEAIDPEAMGNVILESIRDEVRASLGEGADERLAALEEMLSGVNATNVAIESLDASVLARAREAIDEQFAGQPLVRASLLGTIGSVRLGLGQLEEASEAQSEALEIRRRELGAEHPLTLDTAGGLAAILHEMGRTEEALAILQPALEVSRRTLGSDDARTLVIVNDVGVMLVNLGRHEEALPYHEEALETLRRVEGERGVRTLIAMANLGGLLIEMGRYDEARVRLEELLAISDEALEPDDPLRLGAMGKRASLLQVEGRMEEATAQMEEVVRVRRRTQGDQHPETLSAIGNLGYFLKQSGRHEEAMAAYKESLEGRRRVLGPDHPDTLGTLNNLASLLRAMGRDEESLPYHMEVLEGARRVLGDRHPNTFVVMCNTGSLLAALGRFEEAEPLAVGAAEGMTGLMGPEHPNSVRFTEVVIDMYESWDEASPGQGYDAKAAQWRERRVASTPE